MDNIIYATGGFLDDNYNYQSHGCNLNDCCFNIPREITDKYNVTFLQILNSGVCK